MMIVKSVVIAAALFVAVPALAQAPIDVCFRPGPRACDNVIVDHLSSAKKTVLVQAYSFTHKEIAAALVAAKKRGVDVRAILDAGQRSERYSSLDFLANSGIPTSVVEMPGHFHNKSIVIDDQVVITGSYNFTTSAETRNAENVLFIRDASLAAKYRGNWIDNWKLSKPYARRN